MLRAKDDALSGGQRHLRCGKSPEVSGLIIPTNAVRVLQATGNLIRVRTLVSQHLAKADEEKTTDWLYACTKGDNNKVRQVRVSCCSITPLQRLVKKHCAFA